MSQVTIIRNFVAGDDHEIKRRVTGLATGETVSAAEFEVKENVSDVTPTFSKSITVTDVPGTGQIEDNGATTLIAVLRFDLESADTTLLTAGTLFYYSIQVTIGAETKTIETGRIIASEEFTDTLETADTTTAPKSLLYPTRTANLIDGPLDAILHDFRQLKVWDEHVRRAGDDPLRLVSTFRNWNPTVPIEVIDGNNIEVSPANLLINYQGGTLVVTTDDGDQDYFVTYTFNMFPEIDFYNFLYISLHEINSSAEVGTYLTGYATIEATPQHWDGPLVMGAIAKAFNRLATDGTLWKNWLVWQEGNNGQQIAAQAAQYYQNSFDSLRNSVKRGHYLAGPTSTFDIFRNTGFGFAGPYSGKFRGLQVNRMAIY